MTPYLLVTCTFLSQLKTSQSNPCRLWDPSSQLPRALSSGVKKPWREVDCSRQSCPKVRHHGSIPRLPHFYMAWWLINRPNRHGGHSICNGNLLLLRKAAGECRGPLVSNLRINGTLPPFCICRHGAESDKATCIEVVDKNEARTLLDQRL
jgi:hypothetical protein